MDKAQGCRRATDKASWRGTAFREGLRFTFWLAARVGIDVARLGARQAEEPSRWKAPTGYSVEKIKLGTGARMELLSPPGGDPNRVVLQLHGGGYAMGFSDMYRNSAVTYSSCAGGARVASLDYRLAPQHPFPAALEDAVAAYDWLISQGSKPDRLVVAGDSAGGGLALALSLYLRDKGKPLPRALVLMSPWTDLPGEGESHLANLKRDPLFGTGAFKGLSGKAYAGEAALKNPYVSPAYGDYGDMPPMLIQVGTEEQLLSDALTVGEKGRAAGVDARVSVYTGMFHCFPLMGRRLPESRLAWREIGDFLEEQFLYEQTSDHKQDRPV